MSELEQDQLQELAQQAHERVANQTVTALSQTVKALEAIPHVKPAPAEPRPAGWHFFQTRIWALTLDVNRLRQAEAMLRQHPQGKLILEMRQYKLLEHNAMRSLDDVADYIGDDAFDSYVERAQAELNKVFDFMRQQSGAPGVAVES